MIGLLANMVIIVKICHEYSYVLYKIHDNQVVSVKNSSVGK